MSVYVDDMEAPYGRMIMCHMIADTSEELHAMAARIGVARRWCQDEGTYREHYDIALSKRALAVKYGAKEIEMHDVGEMLLARRIGWRNENQTAPNASQSTSHNESAPEVEG